MLLAVWRLDSVKVNYTMHFPHLTGQYIQVHQLYLSLQSRAITRFAVEDGSLAVSLQRPKKAWYL